MAIRAVSALSPVELRRTALNLRIVTSATRALVVLGTLTARILRGEKTNLVFPANSPRHQSAVLCCQMLPSPQFTEEFLHPLS